MHTRIILTACIALMARPFLAAQQQDDCREAIMTYITEMAAVQAPGPGQAYHLHFTMETRSAYPDRSPSYTVEANVLLAATHMTYRTPQMTVMRDAKDAFMIIHPQKRIIWTRGGINPAEQAERIALGTIQKTVVEKASITSCRDDVVDGLAGKIIRLVPDSEMGRKLNVKSFTFFYVPARRQMHKVIIEFARPDPLQQQIVTYHAIDFDGRDTKPETFYTQVFAAPGRLQQKYRGYTLVDNKTRTE